MRENCMQVDTSHVNGEPDPYPRSAIIHNSHIDGSFNERPLEKYLETNIQKGDTLLRSTIMRVH